MSCGKVYEKLWNKYLSKYGDYRERLRLIKNDKECITKFELPRLQVKKRNIPKKCDSLLPLECCHLNHSLILNEDELEKIIRDENFPNNIFQVDIQSRSSIDNDIELSEDIYRLTSPLQSITHPLSMKKSELGTTSQVTSSSYDPTISRNINPYAQLLERLRKEKKTNSNISEAKIETTVKSSLNPSQQIFPQIDPNTHIHIQKFLSFLHSLDDPSNNKQTFDENTLISLFSIDTHLSSSIDISTNIQQLNNIPKPIRHSLKNTLDDEQILHQIQTEISINKKKEFHNIKKTRIPFQ